jgi:NCS1 family nucleobase:cation symporter-1
VHLSRAVGSGFRHGSADRRYIFFFGSFHPGWSTLLGGRIGGHTPTEWLSFLLFWGINIFIIYRGMDLLRHVENWAAPVRARHDRVVAFVDRLPSRRSRILLNEPDKFTSIGEFWKIFVPSLTAMIGFWANAELEHAGLHALRRSQRDRRSDR